MASPPDETRGDKPAIVPAEAQALRVAHSRVRAKELGIGEDAADLIGTTCGG